MEIKKPSIGDYFKTPNPGLRAYFKRTEDGNPDDYRPPFFKGKSRSEVLSMWQKVIDSLGVAEKYPQLYQYEMEMKGKVGPMSTQLPLSERMDSIKAYFTDVTKSSEPIDPRAIKATIRGFSRAGGLRLRSKPKTLEKMHLNSNSGNPWFQKRSVVVKREHVLDWNIHVDPNTGVAYAYNTITGEKYDLCAILGWRGQEGGISSDDVKQRVIWMMSILLNIEELRFYQPAIEAFQLNDLIPAYISMDRVDKEVTALFDSKGNDDVVICTDFTKFDQHFNSDMQACAKEIINGLMTNNEENMAWLDKIFDIKFNLPIICSEDIAFHGRHGMGSGSGGTNFDECMAHKALQYEAAITAHAELNPHSMAYGDDGILTYPGIQVEHVIQTYERHGQEMNASKQYVSKHDCVVLRRWHGDEYRVNGIMVGVYSTFRALGRLLAQERFYDPEKWSAEMVELRQLSILENCKWSPYFHEFIDFVMTGDKYRLGLDLPGFFDNLETKARQATEEFTDFLGYTKSLQSDNDASGINQWEVVKYLRSKLRK